MLKLRELRLEDIDEMYEFIEDNEIASNFIFTRYPSSKEGLGKFITKSWGNHNDIHFAITNEENKYVGTVSLKNINYVDRNAEYAIVLRKNFWGKNYAFEATKQIVEYGFQRINLHKIYLNVLSSNIRANKFYEKVGFKREGVFKEHLYVNGKYEDLNWYYITKKQFCDLNI
jgi:RimJ/RimL family protein N-acetyltransferase